MKLVYPAIFYASEDSPAYAVVVPDLPGCVSGGNSLPEAIAMGEDAASGWILSELEDGNIIPPASPIEDIHPNPEMGKGFTSLLSLDMDAYTAKYGSKSVRKNLTIPAWLNTFAEQKNLNISCKTHSPHYTLKPQEAEPKAQTDWQGSGDTYSTML